MHNLLHTLASWVARQLDEHSAGVIEADVAHSWQGFELVVKRVPTWRWATWRSVESALAAAGHPCCGRGVGRVRFINDVAWRLLNATGHLGTGAQVYSTALSSDGAVAIAPHLEPELAEGGVFYPVNGVDEDGLHWQDGRFFAFTCAWCGEVIPATSYPAAAEDAHELECPARDSSPAV